MRTLLSSLFRGEWSPGQWLTEVMDSADDLWELFDADAPAPTGDVDASP